MRVVEIAVSPFNISRRSRIIEKFQVDLSSIGSHTIYHTYERNSISLQGYQQS